MYSSASASTSAVSGGSLPISGAVVLPGTVSPGMVLVPVLSLNTDQVTYQWYINNTLYSTASMLVVENSMVGKVIRLTVVAIAGSGYNGTIDSSNCFVVPGSSATSPVW